MSWREQLLPASFRGVRFNVRRNGFQFGRKTVVHEYPLRDTPYVEDLGRRARTMRIDAIILGDDYRATRDALIEAIEASGPGKLVHPYYGELTVSLDDSPASIDESDDMGGAAVISFSVVESGEARFPAATAATSDQVAAKADVAATVAGEGVAGGLSVAGMPAFVSASVMEQIDRSLRLVEVALSAATAGDLRSAALGLISGVRPELLSLLSSPANLFGRLRGIYETARGAFTPDSGLSSFVRASRDLVPVTLPAVPTTPQRVVERVACTLFDDTMRTLTVCQAAICAASVIFPDYSTAIETRDRLVDELDRVSEATTDDRLHQALADLRAAVVRDINQRAAELARVVAYVPADTVPALVVAYRLYSVADRDDEIVSRNRISHPGFVPGGVALEVLDDA
ncbi:MAG TPA: DNA circularization N-terminal domain-containing protein [Xanthomonadaceae bacterium]